MGSSPPIHSRARLQAQSCSRSPRPLLRKTMASATAQPHEAIGKEADRDSVRAKAGGGLLCIFAAFYLINMLVKTLPRQPELVT